MIFNEPLVDVIVHSRCPYEDSSQALQDLERAVKNRVGFLFLLSCKEICKKIWSQEMEKALEKTLSDYQNWVTAVKKLLMKLNEAGTRFLVIKVASYPHVSFDIDLVFPSLRDFQIARPILVSSPVRVDPHVAGLREYKALTVVMRAERLWKRRVKTIIHETEVWTTSPEHSLLIHALHAFKHREIYLGDLLSMKEILSQLDVKETIKEAREIGGTVILAYMDHILSTILGEGLGATLPFPLCSLVQLYAEKTLASQQLPLKIPHGMIVLAGLRLRVPLQVRS